MISHRTVPGTVPGHDDVRQAADALVAGLLDHPWGQVSPSVYETGRVVSLTPWLTGHERRLAYLLETQRPDGGWGAPDPGYALCPTLSAVEALLSELRHRYGRPELLKAADRGLRVLARWLDGDGPAIPDMPAVELIAPALVGLVNGHLDALRAAPPPGLGGWSPDLRLRPPAGMDGAVLEMIRTLLFTGADLPDKLWHALEVAGDAAVGARAAGPEHTGTIGASPAATAAWLGPEEPPETDPARRYLEAAVRQHGGPVPCGLPVTVFERGWVLNWLIRAGVPVTVPPRLVTELRAAIGPTGTPAAAGLPADADTTSAALYALSLAGSPYPPDLLWTYETATHFCTWKGEDGRSITTNAHVLEAFGRYAAQPGLSVPSSRLARYRGTVTKVSRWLLEQQNADGSWNDRWHASPYYATVCCVPALDSYGGTESRPAVERAIDWVLETQLPDGSWGVWGGTAEETAYALQVLLLPRAVTSAARRGPEAALAVSRGAAFLRRALPRLETDNPPMWHDKDLYLPLAIVRAATLAALHLAPSDTQVSGR